MNLPDITYQGFYHQEGLALQLDLHSTFVGSSKERMDLVDSNLKAKDVISVLGPYAKFLVEERGRWRVY